MNIIKIAGKYLDQPILVAKFKEKVPYILTCSGAVYTAYAVEKAKEQDKKRTAIRTGVTMGATILSALTAPKITNRFFKHKTTPLKKIKEKNTELINNFLKENQVNDTQKKILEKAKTKILNFKDVKNLYKNKEKDMVFLNKLIPEPENISSKEIFSEIGRLSLLGLIPVIGGILGGIVADRLTIPRWQDRVPNKLKEGAYQYLANIFLCNIGAGISLALMEKMNIKSKSSRAMGMIAGIVATGIVGGSAIANMISNNVINPMFGCKNKQKLYSERKPEALDIGLHADDIATVGVMSGLKWIEPALPIMYAISGYRAGIGYRNVNNCNNKNKH